MNLENSGSSGGGGQSMDYLAVAGLSGHPDTCMLTSTPVSQPTPHTNYPHLSLPHTGEYILNLLHTYTPHTHLCPSQHHFLRLILSPFVRN